jgi:phage I-like protein
MSKFEGGQTDLVVDYEHQSLSGSEAPAAGWIKGLEDRGAEGVWARVQWTERAVEYLKKREYRYISPVVLVRKKDGRAVELLGAALTNLPAIEGMTPVVNGAVVSEPVVLPGFVPEAVHEALKQELRAREVDSLVKEALRDGRLTPPLVPWARSYAEHDLTGFREYLGKACPVAPLGVLTREELPAIERSQREVNRLLGLDDSAFMRYSRATS